MKLQTSIIPRRDGTVRVSGKDKRVYAFEPNDDGQLVADVDDEELIARLLQLGTFYPDDPADYDAATALVGDNAPVRAQFRDGLDETVPGEGGFDDDRDDAPVDPSAPPLEANTTPRPRRHPRKAR